MLIITVIRRSAAMVDSQGRHYRSEQQAPSPLRPQQQTSLAQAAVKSSAAHRQAGSCASVCGPWPPAGLTGELQAGTLGPLETQMSMHLARNSSVTQRLHQHSGQEPAPGGTDASSSARGPAMGDEGGHARLSPRPDGTPPQVQEPTRPPAKVPALALHKLKGTASGPQASPRGAEDQQGSISSKVYAPGPSFQQPTQASLHRSSPRNTLQQQQQGSPRARSLSPRAGHQLARSHSWGSNRGSPRGQAAAAHAQAPARSPLGLSATSSLSKVTVNCHLWLHPRIKALMIREAEDSK